jgi:serine phosphatase RsbU (regulator of sigma subunit)
MEHGAKAYARKILLLHLLLLVALFAVMGMTSREVYYSARQQAIDQAKKRQELLSAQTVRGVEGFYTTIISDLRRRAETDESAATQPAATQPERLAIARPRNVPTEPLFLWVQLTGRASALFGYNRNVIEAENAVDIWEPHEPLPAGEQAPVERPAQQGRRGEAGRLIPPPPPVLPRVRLDVVRLVTSARDWLNQVDRGSVSGAFTISPDSPLQSPTATGTVNLVVVPYPRGPWIIVAVVPAAEAQARILPGDKDPQVTNVTLADSDANIVLSTNPDLFGGNLGQTSDPQIQGIVDQNLVNPHAHGSTVSAPTSLTIGSSLVTIAPVDMPQAKWTLIVSSPMSEVDRVVQNIFGNVLYWAGFLALAMTAILVSTAMQFIRARSRMDRIQNEILTREMAQARQIQLNWLPNPVNAGTALDIAAVNQPASHISGDFYNWFELPDGRHVITIGDVTGHGMSAAFLMATTQLLVRVTMPRLLDPGACMGEVNRQLCTQVFHGQFVTMLILVLDLESRTIDVATAGHAPPLVSYGKGAFSPLPVKAQLVLAVDGTQEYPTQRFKLDETSSLFLYTDGVIDVQSPAGDRLDAQRLREILQGTYETAQAMLDHVAAAIAEFRGKQELGDDLTMVAIQIQTAAENKGAKPAAHTSVNLRIAAG